MSWTLIQYLPNYQDKFGRKFALYRCECGKEKPVCIYSVTNGTSRSCGCLVKHPSGKEHPMYKHGQCMKENRTKEWRAWNAMIRRCTYPSMDDYPRYGGAGITVCKRWKGKDGFIHFLSDVGKSPTPKHSLDRIKNEGNYEPRNVKWSTASEQVLNSKKARFIIFNGQTHNISKWAEITSIERRVIQSRLDVLGWPIEKALTVKPRHIKPRQNSLDYSE